MHTLATSYQPVATAEEEEDEHQHTSLNGGSKPSRSFADYLPHFGSFKLGSAHGRRPSDPQRGGFYTFTTAVFGWPMPEHDPARETAWLDGLRGLAAFLVMIYHFNLNWYFPMGVEEPWGAKKDEHGWDLWRMPFLRLWMCSGHTQVSIFFVLSGFVLSWAPLASIRAGNYEKLYKGLGSSAFRRWLRLYLPTIPVAFWECIEFYMGWREIGKLEVQPNFLLQLWDFIKASEEYMNPIAINRDAWSSLHPYDWTMWTIPYEFSGSLLVFMTLLGVGRIKSYPRRTIAVSIITIYCAFRAEWSYWLFSNGILIADYIHENGGFAKLSERQSSRSIWIWTALLICALWLAGVPTKQPAFYSRPGYDWLDSLTPDSWSHIEDGGRLWWNIAGLSILFCCCHLSGVRRFFEFSFMRYLGRVSYMLYLTHRVVLEPALRPVRDWLVKAWGRDGYIDLPADNTSPSHWFVSIGLYLSLLLVTAPTCILVAHWCERLIDAPSVRFARWVEERLMGGITKRVDSRAAQADPGESLPTSRPPQHGDISAPYRDEPAGVASSSAGDISKHEQEAETVELMELPPRSDTARPPPSGSLV